MKIKKLGHCCLTIETNGKRIMTDPGSYTVDGQTKEKNIDLILITHEHGDHLHVESLKEIIKNNPNAKIITNNGVGKLLDEAGIKYEVLNNKIATKILGIELEAHDCRHEEIFEEIGQVPNTGYFIDRKLFYPGDSFYNPQKPIEILALPITGPWTNIKNPINYALAIKPKVCFPVHDWNIKDPSFINKIPRIVITKQGIEFKVLKIDQAEEF